MFLNSLKPKHQLRDKKTRVGRGGKRGTTSGKGTKGQKSRSGHRIRPAERDFIQRLPKLRGFKNKSRNGKIRVINLEELIIRISGSDVTPDTLRAAGLIRRGETVKILGGGDPGKKLTVKGISVSGAARKKIEAAGGAVE